MTNDPYGGQPGPGAPQPHQPKSSKKPILIIVALVVILGAVPCLGIVAAISIPAFLRYIKVSKSAEAEATLSQMATGVEAYAAENCAFPPGLERHADLEDCAGGAKCLPTGDVPDFWAEAGNLTEPKYFVYSAAVEGDTMRLTAEADFNIASPEIHTQELTITLQDCSTEKSPAIVMNEFE